MEKEAFVGNGKRETEHAVWNKRIRREAITRIAGHPLGARFLKDRIFREEAALYIGLAANCLYAVVQFIAGIFCHSLWFGALAAYYFLLAVIRFLLLRHLNRREEDRDFYTELRQYRICGVVLLLMTPVFAGILIIVVHKNSHAGYYGFLIYLIALCTFCKVITATVNMIKYRQCGSPVITAAKVINLITAVMSVLILETAMLSRFGGRSSDTFYQGMIGTSGGAVCLFVLGSAIIMIVRATRQLKETEQEVPIEKKGRAELTFCKQNSDNSEINAL